MKKLKFVKKFSVLLIMCILVFSLCACSKEEEEEESSKRRRNSSEETETTDTPTPDITEAPTYEPTPIPTDEPVMVPTDYPSPTPTVPATLEVTPEPTPETPTGPEVSELPDIQTVFDTYYDYVRDQMDDEYTLFDTMRFGLALIDNDDLPELLIADADYHGSAVRVIFYNNGEPKEVGQFGGYGGCAYVKKENKIISSFMNMGVTTIQTYHIDPEYNAVLVDDLYSEDTEDSCLYKVNNEEVTMDDFDAAIDRVTAPEFGNTKLYVEYNDLLPYYPYVCDEKLKDSFDQMYEQLKDDNYISFSGYYNENMESLEGTWILEKGVVDTRNGYLYYDSEGDPEWNEGALILSEATIDSDGTDIIFTAYKDDELFDIDLIDLSMWNMKEVYFNNSISEGLDYGWGVQAVPNEYTDWSIFMCTDEEGKLRVLIFRYPDDGETYDDGYPIGEFVDLTYTKAFDVKGCSSVSAFLERAESEDKDGMKAFKAQEYLFINPSTPEDIKVEYGYPADYDDFELETSHKEAYIIYVDDNTAYTLLDRFNVLLDMKATYEEFESRAAYGAFRIYFETMAGAEDYTGAVAVAIQEDYIG